MDKTKLISGYNIYQYDWFNFAYDNTSLNDYLKEYLKMIQNKQIMFDEDLVRIKIHLSHDNYDKLILNQENYYAYECLNWDE